MAAGTVVFLLSACGQTEGAKEPQEDTERLVIEKMDDADVQNMQNDDPTETDSTESIGQELTSNPQDEQEPIQDQ